MQNDFLQELDNVLNTSKENVIKNRKKMFKQSVRKIFFARLIRLFSLGLIPFLLICLYSLNNWILALSSYVLFFPLRGWLPRIKWRQEVRPPILVLRSFTDNQLINGGTDWGESKPVNYISQLALNVWDLARVVILQEEKNTNLDVYSIVINSTFEDWSHDVINIAYEAWAVLIFPGKTMGVVEEMRLLKEHGLLEKTIIFMPPTHRIWKTKINYKSEWESIKEYLNTNKFNLPEYRDEGLLYVPNEDFSINRSISLNGNEYSWRKIQKLIGKNYLSLGALDMIPFERAYESEFLGKLFHT